jgi:uncharacterized repeat protein (TIGR03943 family)
LRRSVATRWLGVGLASGLAVVTLALAATGRLALYISPSSNWFAIPMAILLLVGAVASFLLPLGAEEDHGHDHGDHGHDHEGHDHHDHGTRSAADTVRLTASVAGGVVASGVVLSILLLPPASLSPDAVATRETGSAPLFSGSDLVSLATHGDTTAFGVGDWASVFATATNPGAFEGDAVTLTGFVSPGSGSGGFDLTRLVITHCVIDAQVARIPVASTTGAPDKGQWVTITGTVRSTSDGTLEIDANKVTRIAEPKDPYEY